MSHLTVFKHIEDFGNLEDCELEELFIWLDRVPLSRPKRNINRDFAGKLNCSTMTVNVNDYI